MTSQSDLEHVRLAQHNAGVNWDRDQCVAHLMLTNWLPKFNRNSGQYVLWHEDRHVMLRPIHVNKTRYVSVDDWGSNIAALTDLTEYDTALYPDQFLRQAVERTLEMENHDDTPYT